MWTEMSNKAILFEIGNRMRNCRIRKNMQQQELAIASGVNVTTIQRLEKGLPVTTEKLISVLRALDILENIEGLLPTPPLSPILMRKLQGKTKMRVRNTKKSEL